MSVHHFDTDVAAMVGPAAATIAYNIKHWCEKNAANGKHEHDDRNWTYNSVTAFKEMFPYLSEKQIRTALDKLESAGLIVSGRYNQQARDQTKWYSFVDEAVVIAANRPKRQVQLPKRAEPFAQKGRPLPDNKPDNKPSTNVDVGAQSADTPNPPKAIEPVKAKQTNRRGSRLSESWGPVPQDYAYATSKGLDPMEINNEADRFRNYWVAQAGRKGVKLDWSATWRNWITSEFGPVARKAKQAASAQRSASVSDHLDRVAHQLEFGTHASDGRGQSPQVRGQERHGSQTHAGHSDRRGQGEVIDADGYVIARPAF